jgi:hypothetical protein
MDNSGLYIGGNVTGSNVLTGANSQVAVSQSTGTPPASSVELEEALGQLLVELERHRRQLSPDVLESAQDASDELKRHRPRKQVLLGFLTTVADGVAAMTGLAGIVAPLIKAVESIFT